MIFHFKQNTADSKNVSFISGLYFFWKLCQGGIFFYDCKQVYRLYHTPKQFLVLVFLLEGSPVGKGFEKIWDGLANHIELDVYCLNSLNSCTRSHWWIRFLFRGIWNLPLFPSAAQFAAFGLIYFISSLHDIIPHRRIDWIDWRSAKPILTPYLLVAVHLLDQYRVLTWHQ